MQNPVNKSYYGYTGLFRAPYSNNAGYGDSLYLITDESHYEANLIVLSDHFFHDAYRLLSCPTYQEIHIFVPSLDTVWISDLFGLVMSLKAYKKNVYWHYPTGRTLTEPINVQFDMSQLRPTLYQSKRINNLMIRLISNNGFYDFEVINGDKKEYFTVCTTEEQLKGLIADHEAIHMPYNTYYYGGDSAREIACGANAKQYTKYIIPNSFRNRDEFIEAAHTPFAFTPRLIG